MSDALHAEWTKLRTVASTAWFVVAATIATVALSAIAVAAGSRQSGAVTDPTRLSLTGIELGQAVLVVLAVMMVAGEYATGLISVTLTAVPRRLAMLSAKAVVVGSVALVVGLVGVGGSLLAGRLLLDGEAAALVTLGDATTLRAAIGSVLYLALIALMSLGVATAVRDAASAVSVVFALLYLFPILALIVENPDWQRRLQQLGPRTAGLAIQTTVESTDLPIGPIAGLVVLGGWAVGSLALGAVFLHRRDA